MNIMGGKQTADKGETLISLSPAEDSDGEFIKRLSGDVFNLYGPYDETIPNWFRSERSNTIIARAEVRPIGFVMLGRSNSRYDLQSASELLAIAVDPKWQGRRIGESLLRGAERMALDLDIKRIFLHTATDNLRAQRLFIRVGYRPWEIRRSFYPQGQDAYVMVKEPDPEIQKI